jgi:hypothetical protein
MRRLGNPAILRGSRFLRTPCVDAAPHIAGRKRKIARQYDSFPLQADLPMTYCVAIKLKAGLVFLSDSRTNAGVDQISTFRKMMVYEKT